MPEQTRQMTEASERIASLETNMGYVLGVLAKREEYQTSVLKSLTTIEIKQDQAFTYQKTCDAERSAHAARLGMVENGLDAMARTLKTIEDHAGRLAAVEKSVADADKALKDAADHGGRLAAVERHISRGSTIWWFVFRVAGSVSGLVALAAALAGLWRHP